MNFGNAFIVKISNRKSFSITTVDLIVDTYTHAHAQKKNYEIREKDSAHNKSKPLLRAAWSIVLEMRLGTFYPGCRTSEQR